MSDDTEAKEVQSWGKHGRVAIFCTRWGLEVRKDGLKVADAPNLTAAEDLARKLIVEDGA